jgi:hypothetical protein
MANYGIPYQGSKDKIARSLACNFPKADHFYDLFGGGFSMTHYMALNRSKQYKHFHYNEIESCTVDLVRDAIAGKFSYENFKPPWVSREAFFKNIKDPYIRICWSFGNNQSNYLFSKEIEPYKKSMHMAVIFDEFDDLAYKVFRFKKWPDKVNTVYKKRIYLRQIIEHYRKTKIPECLYPFLPIKQLQRLQQLQHLQQLQRLEHLQRLERVQRLESIKTNSLSMTAKDYRDVEILPNSVVYCDIPYVGTTGYLKTFNHKEFYDWAATREFAVYVSEYRLDDPRFKCIYSVDKHSLMDSKVDKKKLMQEKLFWNGKSNG